MNKEIQEKNIFWDTLDVLAEIADTVINTIEDIIRK